MSKYIVVEICDRVCEYFVTEPLDTLEEAIAEANRRLTGHCENIGCTDELEKHRNDPDYGWAEIGEATSETLNAWCNLKGFDWDAWVMEVQSN